MVTTYHTSANRAFANPAFWDFVRDIENRDNAGHQPILSVENRDETTPPAYEKSLTQEATSHEGGKGQFLKLRHRLAAKGLSEEEIAARIEKRRVHKNTVPTFAMLRKRLAEKGFSEEDIEARIAKRQARKNGTGDFPKLRQRLTEKGFSEEQIAARVEKCRGRRAAARANKAACAEQTQAFADESKGQMINETGCRYGPRRHAHRRGAARPIQSDVSEKNVTTVQNVDDATKTTTAGNAGGDAFVPYRRLQDITKGGLPKFAPYFNKQGATPSNGNMAQTGTSEEKTSEGELNKRMDCLAVVDSDDSPTDTSAKKQAKKMKKINKGNGHMKGKGNKNFPRADVFQTSEAYIVHVAIPGAKPEDVAVTWDPEKSAVRVAGVIYRSDPKSLGNDGALIRGQRFVGQFDRKINLGKKKEAVKVYENGLTAILSDGILNIEVPKYDGADDSDDFIEVNEKA